MTFPFLVSFSLNTDVSKLYKQTKHWCPFVSIFSVFLSHCDLNEYLIYEPRGTQGTIQERDCSSLPNNYQCNVSWRVMFMMQHMQWHAAVFHIFSLMLNFIDGCVGLSVTARTQLFPSISLGQLMNRKHFKHLVQA